MKIVGRSEEGKPIVDGKWVLQMVDTHGIPLMIVNSMLEERGWGFDVCGFIEACLDNPNYSPDKCLSTLRDSTTDKELHLKFELAMIRVLKGR